MASAQGDQYTVRIDGDVSGTVVAGRDNRVDTGPAAPPGTAPSAGTAQAGTAKDHGTVYSVQDGDMHVHHHDPAG